MRLYWMDNWIPTHDLRILNHQSPTSEHLESTQDMSQEFIYFRQSYTRYHCHSCLLVMINDPSRDTLWTSNRTRPTCTWSPRIVMSSFLYYRWQPQTWTVLAAWGWCGWNVDYVAASLVEPFHDDGSLVDRFFGVPSFNVSPVISWLTSWGDSLQITWGPRTQLSTPGSCACWNLHPPGSMVLRCSTLVAHEVQRHVGWPPVITGRYMGHSDHVRIAWDHFGSHLDHFRLSMSTSTFSRQISGNGVLPCAAEGGARRPGFLGVPSANTEVPWEWGSHQSHFTS